VVVGELEVAALSHVERWAFVRELLYAVHPCIEVAVAARGPLHVVNEIVPGVVLNRTDRRGEFAVGGLFPSIAPEAKNRRIGIQQRIIRVGRERHNLQMEIGLPRTGGAVMEIEDDIPGK
jgi:hypothetical protein